MVDQQSFADLVVATARQKHAATMARQSPSATAEKPREAIFNALRMVGEAIAEQGFLFTPSGPKFSRRSGDFTFAIYIQSDRNNVTGQRAAIWVHVGVYSKSLTAWSKRQPSDWVRPKSSFPEPVVGNQLGYLCAPSGWVEWDFADSTKRRSVADDLIASLRQGAFPLFAAFEGAPEDIAAIANQSLRRPEGILGYLLSIGRASLATEVLQAYLNGRPKVWRDFKRHCSQFLEHGIPAYGSVPTDDARTLAAFAVGTGLPLNGS